MAKRGTAVVGTCTTAGRSMLPLELMKNGEDAERLERGESLYAFSSDGECFRLQFRYFRYSSPC